MKILVSDYDGTFNSFYFKKAFKKNLDSVNDFRTAGNIFIIATARSPKHMYKEIEKWDIKCDYLICNNGNVVLDSNKNVLFSSVFDKEYVTQLIETTSYLYDLDSSQCIAPYGENPANAPFTINDQTLKLINVKSAFYEFGLKVDTFLNNIKFSRFSNKRDGLIELLKKIRISLNDPNIYSIGNSINDIELLKTFNGFKVPWSNPYLLFRSDIPTIGSVHSLTKKIQEEK